MMTGTWKQMMKNWILTEQIIGENAYDGENEQMVVCTYEDVEEFLEKSGWRRDNPELCSECYLFENHICRKIQGKIWYFSRIQYENGLRGMKQGFN